MTLITRQTVDLLTVALHSKTSETFNVSVHEAGRMIWKKDGTREESIHRYDGIVTGIALAAGVRPNLPKQEDGD